MNRKTLANYFYNLSYRVIALIVPLVITPYISRVLMPEGVGRYAVSAVIVNYFVLAGMLGILQYGNREVAYVRDDKKQLRKTFWEINILRFITMGCSLIAFTVYVCIFVDRVLFKLYFIQIFTLIASFFDISWLFTGVENFKATAIKNACVKLSGVFAVFLLVKSPEDIWVYAAILSGSTCFGQIIMWSGIFKRIPFILPEFKEIKKHFKATIRLWVPTIAISIYTSLDKIMLGTLTSEAQVGFYENSQKMVIVVTTITTTLANVMLPKMSNYYKTGRMDEYKASIYKCFTTVSFIAFPMAFGIMSVSNMFVPIFFGTGYEVVAGLLKISALLVITLSWSSIFGTQVLVSCGCEKQYTIAVSVGAVINVFLNILFIKKLQAFGAISASVIAEYTGMFIMAVYVIRKFKLNLKELLRSIPKYVLGAIIMIVVSSIINPYTGTGLRGLFFQVFSSILIYLICMTLFHEETMFRIIITAKSKIRKRRGL